jgi:hypothetical protein
MKVARLSAQCTCRFTPWSIPGTHFCQRLSRPQGHSATGRIMPMKNSNDTIGNRSRDLPVCNAVLHWRCCPKICLEVWSKPRKLFKCNLFADRDLNLGSPECEAGMFHSRMRRPFSREVGETGLIRAPQLWAYTVFVSEVTGSVVRNETEEECLILGVERPDVHSRELAWLGSDPEHWYLPGHWPYRSSCCLGFVKSANTLPH